MAKAVAKQAVGKRTRAKKSSSRAAAGPRATNRRRTRPNNLMLADLLLWITVVDECQYHPHGALERAAVVEGLTAGGNLNQRLTELEARFGKLFHDGHIIRPRGRRPAGGRRNRSGVPTARAAALAEIFVLIEHLYRWATGLGGWPEKEMKMVREIKRDVLSLFPWPPLRTLDKLAAGTDRVARSVIWRSRLKDRTRTKRPAKFSDLKPMLPSPEYSPVDFARSAAERRLKRKQRRETQKEGNT